MPDAEARLGALVEAGRMAWPTLSADAVAFIEHAGSVAPDEDAQTWLQRLRPDDLWLAFCCASGDSRAVAAFERSYAVDLGRVVHRFATVKHPREDLLQILRDKLFVSEGQRRAKIASYSGIGFLQNWLRIAAVRTFVDLSRAKRTPSSETPLDEAYAATGDFEVDFLKQRYRDQFKAAFAEAMRGLEPESRNLLRYRVQGLTVDGIASIEGVHRATAARRVAKARESLLGRTRARLADRLSVPGPELDSIMRLINSRLDLSIERLLRPAE